MRPASADTILQMQHYNRPVGQVLSLPTPQSSYDFDNYVI